MTSKDLTQPIRQPALELSREQIVELLEKGTRRRLGMSAQDFLRLYREGRIPDAGAVGDLIVLADLLGEEDPLIKAA
jgi:hypothetical protein